MIVTNLSNSFNPVPKKGQKSVQNRTEKRTNKKEK